MKTSKPGKHIAPLELKTYPADKNLCPVTLISKYLELIKAVRGMFINFFLSHKAPYWPVKTSTLSRWCRDILQLAGVEDKFKSHATRAASTSAAKQRGVPLQEINRAAGWRSTDVFARFYDRPVRENLGETLLNSLYYNQT